MRVLVTGGAGFIGSHVVDELRWKDHEPVILTNNLPAARDPDTEYVFGDIRNAELVDWAVSHAEGVIHLAGVLGTQETVDRPRPAATTNIFGGLNVLDSCRNIGIPLINIGVGNHWMNNTYSISKSTVERFAAMYAKEHGAYVTTVRALNAYGPGQSVSYPYGTSPVRKIMPSFINRVLHGQPIEIYGDGEQIMDMVYVDDVARTLIAALEKTALLGPLPTIECGTGRPTSVLKIARTVIDTIGRGTIEHLPMRPGEEPGSVVLADPVTLRHAGVSAQDFMTLEAGTIHTVTYYEGLL